MKKQNNKFGFNILKVNNKHLKALLSFVCIIIQCMVILELNAQDFPNEVEGKLSKLTIEIPAMNDTISMSVSEWPLQEFLRGVANYSKLNFDIASDIDNKITVNFSKVKVVDVLAYVSKQYKLDITNQGAIISITRFPPIIPDDSKEVVYDASHNTLSIDVKQKKLSEVIRKITNSSGRNIVPEPGLEDAPVTAFVQILPFQNALEKLAFSNNLSVNKTKDSVYILTRNKVEALDNNGIIGDNKRQRRNTKDRTDGYELTVTPKAKDSIMVNAVDAPLTDIITEACKQLQKSYFFTSKIEGTATFDSKPNLFDTFLSDLLVSTGYTFKKQNNTYFFGERKQNEIKESRSILLQNRTVTKLTELLPKSLTTDLEITEFAEQNSFLISGAYDKVNALERFITSIDKPVPVILIEVIIVDVNNSYIISTGIEAGITDKTVQTKGTLYPGLDMQLSSSSINNILKGFNGFGTKNLGVKPNVYLTLKAMEDQGLVTVRSTPQLSTLNGHEAKLSIGSTVYYSEKSSNIIGSIGTQVSNYQTYKSLDAQLAVTIKPIVSGNNKITLDIEVNQSGFADSFVQDGPPTIKKKDFKSIINVNNQETVILGGLDETQGSDISSGVPLISRIPILKWFFSSRTKKDVKSKLNIFIKPTIIN